MADLVAPLVAAYTEQLRQSALMLKSIYPDPSPEEIAERKADREAASSRVDAAIDGVTNPALRAVLDLHKRNGMDCDGCDPGSYAESGAWWPCSTIYTLAPFVGIEESDLKLI
jgi:hypothetical protein